MGKILHLIQKNKWSIATILIVCGTFYWYEWRPTQIEKGCAEAVLLLASNGSSDQNDELYNLCVRSGGIDNMMEAVNNTN
jgi:hypothetical protein